MMKIALLLAFLVALQSEAGRTAVITVVPPQCEPQKAAGGAVGALPKTSEGARVFRLKTPPPFQGEEIDYRGFLASFNTSSLTGFYRAPTNTEPGPRDESDMEVIGVLDKRGELPVEPTRGLRQEDEGVAAEHRNLNVFLPDNRVDVNENVYPYRVVGKWRGCTATMVYAPGIVVTNAHCLKYKADGTMDPEMWDAEFFAGYNNGAFLAKSKPKAIWYDKDLDYAVLKLWKNLDTTLGRMGVWWRSASHFNTDRALSMISYSGDHCQTANNCRQKLATGKSRGQSSGHVRHDLDAKRGSSGSAMWAMYNGIPVMEALNRAEDRDGGEASLTLSSYDGTHPNFARPAGEWKYGYDKVKNF